LGRRDFDIVALPTGGRLRAKRRTEGKTDEAPVDRMRVPL
jgi:hypothetical protein